MWCPTASPSSPSPSVGEAGEAGHYSSRGWGGAAGGQGSKVTGTMNVTPGQTLWIGVAAGTALPGGKGGESAAQGTIGYGGKGGNASYIVMSEPDGSNCIITQSQLAYVAALVVVAAAVAAPAPRGTCDPTLMHGGAGGTELVHGDGYDADGNNADGGDHDGKAGKAATAIAHGAGGQGAAAGSPYIFDPRSGSPSPGIGSCIPGQHGEPGSLQNGGWGGVAPVPGNFLDDKCMGFMGVQRAGGGGGGGGGYYSGGGGGGADSGNGSGGGGGAGNSYLSGGGTIEATYDEPQVTLRPMDTPPAITSASTVMMPVNDITHFTVTTSGFPLVHFGNTQNLPAWLTVTDKDNGTADVRGLPPLGTTGSFPVALRAFNSVGGSATQTLMVTVTGPPTITSPSSAVFKAGVPNSFIVTTTGDPKPSIGQNQTLPGWLSLTDNHDGTATFSGTPPVSNVASWTTTLSAGDAEQPARRHPELHARGAVLHRRHPADAGDVHDPDAPGDRHRHAPRRHHGERDQPGHLELVRARGRERLGDRSDHRRHPGLHQRVGQPRAHDRDDGAQREEPRVDRDHAGERDLLARGHAAVHREPAPMPTAAPPTCRTS